MLLFSPQNPEMAMHMGRNQPLVVIQPHLVILVYLLTVYKNVNKGSQETDPIFWLKWRENSNMICS
jgi:hypothetical protein